MFEFHTDATTLTCSLFMGLLNGPIMQNLQKVQGRIERKICAVGMTRLLTKSEKIMGSDYAEVW